jgi:hypothetical protein
LPVRYFSTTSLPPPTSSHSRMILENPIILDSLSSIGGFPNHRSSDTSISISIICVIPLILLPISVIPDLSRRSRIMRFYFENSGWRYFSRFRSVLILFF